MRRDVSAILSVYNGENYLSEAIQSLLDQDYPHREIIVVDDGSTDKTPAIIRSFGTQIRSIRQVNRGSGPGRNAGVDAATGDYLAFLDHDDLWAPDKLSRQVEQINELDPLIFGHIRQFICPTLTPEERGKLIVDETPQPGYFAGTMLISKKRFLEVGYFTEKNEVGEFVDWFLRAKELNLPMRVVDQTLLHRRVHLRNMGRQSDRYDAKAYLRILKAGLDRRRKGEALPSRSSFSMAEADPRIHSRGYWRGTDIVHHHAFDPPLADAIASFLSRENARRIADFGCGMGDYVKKLLAEKFDCVGFDGNPATSELSGGVASVLDLSQPFDLNQRFDWLLCLEVGEHIPKQYESTLIENLSRHALKGIILSWAVRGQGGYGHFNEQDNGYIKQIMNEQQLQNDLKTEETLRAKASLPWFHNTIMVFRKT